MACNGPKMGSVHLFGHPKLSQDHFWKNTFLTHFSSQNNPFSRQFVTLKEPKWLAMGPKWGHFTPNGLGSFFGSTHF